jgi:hypothetical protein
MKIFLAGIFLSLNLHAGQETHGGDIAVSLFMGVTHKSLECIISHNTYFPNEFFVIELESMINRVKVYSVDRTFINENEVDAINNRDIMNPIIRLNRSRWLSENLTDVLRARLVIHEFLSLLGYDDSNYQISFQLVEQHKQCIGERP